MIIYKVEGHRLCQFLPKKNCVKRLRKSVSSRLSNDLTYFSVVFLQFSIDFSLISLDFWSISFDFRLICLDFWSISIDSSMISLDFIYLIFFNFRLVDFWIDCNESSHHSIYRKKSIQPGFLQLNMLFFESCCSSVWICDILSPHGASLKMPHISSQSNDTHSRLMSRVRAIYYVLLLRIFSHIFKWALKLTRLEKKSPLKRLTTDLH